MIINVTGGPDLSLDRSQRGVGDHPGSGARGRQHHLRRGRRSEDGGQGEDHRHRHRLRSPAAREAGRRRRRRRRRSTCSPTRPGSRRPAKRGRRRRRCSRMTFSRRPVLEMPDRRSRPRGRDGSAPPGRRVRAGVAARRAGVPAAAERRRRSGRSAVRRRRLPVRARARLIYPRHARRRRFSAQSRSGTRPAGTAAASIGRLALVAGTRDRRLARRTIAARRASVESPARLMKNWEQRERARETACPRSRLRPQAAWRPAARRARVSEHLLRRDVEPRASRRSTGSSTSWTTWCASGCSCRPKQELQAQLDSGAPLLHARVADAGPRLRRPRLLRLVRVGLHERRVDAAAGGDRRRAPTRATGAIRSS